MCGIAGFLDPSAASSAAERTARVQAMCQAIAHRGPDDSGTYVEASAGIGLGHRRLSIIDLSPLGHQPMTSADSRYVITYNGEVYNHQALRRELEGHVPRPAPVPKTVRRRGGRRSGWRPARPGEKARSR